MPVITVSPSLTHCNPLFIAAHIFWEDESQVDEVKGKEHGH